jgi:hypothetical protein
MNAKFLLSSSLLLCVSLTTAMEVSLETFTRLQKRIDVLEIDRFKETKDERLGKIQSTLHAIGIVPKKNDDVTIIHPSKDGFNCIEVGSSQLRIIQKHAQLVDNHPTGWFLFSKEKKNALACQKNYLNLEMTKYKENANKVYNNFLQLKRTDIPSVEQLSEEYNKLKALQESVNTLHGSGLELIKQCEDLRQDTVVLERKFLGVALFASVASLLLIGTSRKSKL